MEIRTAVKEEGRVKTSSNLDSMIDRIINDVYIELCQNAEYDELFVPDAALAITADQQTVFAKPADMRQLAYIEFSTDNEHWDRLVKRNAFSLPHHLGFPRWFFVNANGIQIYPFSNTLMSHFFRVAYWKNPPILASGDPILVGSLYNSIVKRTIDRILRYHQDEKSARVFRQDALESEGRVVE